MTPLSPDLLAPITLIAALALDAWIGDPRAVYRVAPHPAALIGGLLSRLDKRWNDDAARDDLRRLAGCGALLVTLAVPTALASALVWSLSDWPYGWMVEAAVASVFLAQRSLAQHVGAVAHAFDGGGLAAARDAVSHIVGRDPTALDEAGVSRAAIESCAENFSDGVVAPTLWFALLGLPGIVAYKAINTADSMIGHKTDRHLAFGWAAARLDDLANWPAARVSGLLIVAASLTDPEARAWAAFKTMLRDAGKHRSPNAGWPEAAMAGAIGVALAGPRAYRDHVVEDPFLNAGAQTPTRSDIRRAVDLLWRAWAFLSLLVVGWLIAAVA